MYKLIYLQDAINLLTERHCDICPYNDHRHNGQRCNECDYKEAMDDLEDVPFAELEIILCRNCKHWEREGICDGYCSEMESGGFDEDHFCGYAERRTDG